ncbi:MAG: hypothetical protein AAB962_02655, partial [Patescibacteria group bacterium]
EMSDLPKEIGCDKFSNGSILIFLKKIERKKMSKEPKITNMWKIFEGAGFISDPESKEISMTCEDIDNFVKDDHDVFDVMVTFSHILSCERCRTKYRKKREDQ